MLMQPGDVCIAHQRLAHAPGVNMSQVTRKNVYFRIVHVRHDELQEQSLLDPTPFTGFAGLQNLLQEVVHERVVPGHEVTRERPAPEQTLSINRKQKKTFIKDGYIMLPGAVPMDLVEKALQFTDSAYEKKEYHRNGVNKLGSSYTSPGFYKGPKSNPNVVNLLYKTGLFQVCEQLLGEGNCTLRKELGQIAYVGPCDIFIAEGKDKTMPFPKNKWHIDAGHDEYQFLGADFSLLVGIALSDGQEVDENRGQLNVWPG